MAVTRDRMDRQRALQARYRAAAKRELLEWVLGQGEKAVRDPAAFTAGLASFMSYLGNRWGGAAAASAADWYEDLREDSAAAGRFRAILAELSLEEEAQRAAAYAAAPLRAARDGDDPDAVLQHVAGRAAQPVGRWVKNSAQRTMLANADRDPGRPLVVRVPRGESTCAFCIMLASRGALDGGYETTTSAVKVVDKRRSRYQASKLADFHDDCDCEAVTIWPGDPDPEGWDGDKYASMYRQATDAAGTRGDTTVILAKMREMHDLN